MKALHDWLLARKSELYLLSTQRKSEMASPDVVKDYVDDLHHFIDSNDLLARKAYIESFVKKSRSREVKA